MPGEGQESAETAEDGQGKAKDKSRDFHDGDTESTEKRNSNS